MASPVKMEEVEEHKTLETSAVSALEVEGELDTITPSLPPLTFKRAMVLTALSWLIVVSTLPSVFLLPCLCIPRFWVH